MSVEFGSHKVRAKVSIDGIELYACPEGAGRVKMRAVYTSDTDENKTYSKATPALELSMTVDNPPAFKMFFDAFNNKQYVYLDFTVGDKK